MYVYMYIMYRYIYIQNPTSTLNMDLLSITHIEVAQDASK